VIAPACEHVARQLEREGSGLRSQSLCFKYNRVIPASPNCPAANGGEIRPLPGQEAPRRLVAAAICCSVTEPVSIYIQGEEKCQGRDN
jgi:hypothetical protein